MVLDKRMFQVAKFDAQIFQAESNNTIFASTSHKILVESVDPQNVFPPGTCIGTVEDTIPPLHQVHQAGQQST